MLAIATGAAVSRHNERVPRNLAAQSKTSPRKSKSEPHTMAAADSARGIYDAVHVKHSFAAPPPNIGGRLVAWIGSHDRALTTICLSEKKELVLSLACRVGALACG
jgi:hypothetical protein